MNDSSDELEKKFNNFNKTKKITKEKSDVEVINNIFENVNSLLLSTKINTIKGELISFKNSDCNAYITVKIGDYHVNCTYWRILYSDEYDECKKIKEGDQVTLKGIFTLSKRNLNIYFNIKSMNKVGVGDYLILHKQYRDKIIKDGMHLNKKELCIFPYKIGIITAIEGAAIQDILQTFKLDNFIGKIYIKNTVVQGKQCPQSVIDSITYFETKMKKIDILLITRGGGSYEDLVGFSHWDVIEKIYNSRIKNKFISISAVGHQIDNQLSDEVSDYKMATPSIAAKFIVENQQKYYENYYKICNVIDDLKEKYEESKIKFEKIDNNYEKIVNKYDLTDVKEKIIKYSSFLRKIIIEYNICKNKFYDKITNIKATIFKNSSEVNSISSFINIETKKEVSPKKIEIIFVDGKVELYYKIVNYNIN